MNNYCQSNSCRQNNSNLNNNRRSTGNCQNRGCQRVGNNCCPLLDSHFNCPTPFLEPRNCENMPDKNCLLKEINEHSFAVNDMQLYLDSHPCDVAAIDYIMEHKKHRVAALKEYAKYYGPLTIDTANDEASDSFAWSETPWPWEGGNC